MTSDDNAPTTLRPNQRVFVGRPIARLSIVLGLVALAAHFFLPLFVPFDPGLVVWLGIGAAIVAGYSVNRYVTYRRTSYELYGDRMVVHTGSILTRGTIDLPYRNVTQVVLRLPFIEHRLFSTGHLSIHAAGSSQGIAHLESIDDSQSLYDRIADHLRDNGFSLQRSTRLQRESPHLVGTIIDTSGLAIGGLLGLITVGLTVGGAVIDLMELQNFYELYDVLIGGVEADDPEDAAIAFRGTLGLAILGVLAGTAGLAKLAIHFVDLNRRTYTLWDDVVDYRDGFLTETYKFVPVENLADTATVVPFLKRLFGMADVHLSPHGSASGIQFPSMPRASEFRDHLDRIIETTDGPGEASVIDAAARPPEADGDDAPQSESEALPAGHRRRLPDTDAAPLDFGPSYLRRSATAVIDTLKLVAMISVLGAAGYGLLYGTDVDAQTLDIPVEDLSMDLILISVGVFAGIFILYQIGKALFFCAVTDYRVGRRKVSRQRDFISRDEFEFTMDKITTLVVERDVVDRLMGSATVTFLSIGATRPLVFEDVGRAASKVDEIRRRLGLDDAPEDAGATHRPKVNPLDALAGRLYGHCFVLALVAGSYIASLYWPVAGIGALLFGALFVYRVIRDLFYYPRCRMDLHDDHLAMRRGILLIQQHWVPYDQIRSASTTRYPGRSRGTLEVVPGSSRRVSLRYLDDLHELHEDLDERLYDHPMRPVQQFSELDRTPFSERRPMARNAIISIGLWTLSLSVITVIPTALIYLYARRTSIVVEEERLRLVRGILFRTTKTVLTNRIDQLLKNRGPLHTLLRNGQVSILTVGSSVPELQLGPVADEEVLYDEIEARLPGK